MTPETVAERKPAQRWRRHARIALEIAIAFALLAALDEWLTGGLGFAGVRPSPYWIPVLVMALVYGTGPGVAAAVIASGLWLLAAHRDGSERDYLDWLLHLSIPPLLWAVVAVAVGEVTLARKRHLAKALRRGAQAVRDVGRMTDAHERLTRTNRDLQRRIAADPRTAGHIIATASRLSSPDPAARRGALSQLIGLAAHGDDFTCYRLGPDGARAWMRGGAVTGASMGRPDLLPPAMIEALAASGEMRVRHVARRGDREWLAGLGVAAVPLADGQGGLSGVLLFHDLPIDRFNAHRIAELAEIGHWLGPLILDQGQAPLRVLRNAGRIA